MEPSNITFKNLNIHLLGRKKDYFKSDEKIEKFIAKTLKNFNDKQTDESDKYQPIPLTEWNVQENNHFHAKIYFSRRPTKSKFAQWVSSVSNSNSNDFENVSVYFVLFLYRQIEKQIAEKEKTEKVWELFALTKGDGYRLIKSYASFKFPFKVALRIIDPELSAAEKKPLAGHTDTANETYRSDYPLKQNEMETVWKWFKGFHSHFKLKSSLYNPKYELSAFKGKSNKVAVKIASGKIEISKDLTIFQYEELLIHFSDIYQGKETHDIEGKVEVDDPGIRSLENIQVVEDSLAKQLNEGLFKLVHRALDPKNSLSGIFFVHRFYNDFYKSALYTIKFGRDEFEWTYKPSLTAIMVCLREMYGPVADYKAFLLKFSETKFKFDNRKEFFPLQDFFHGELRFKEDLYFRVDGVWLKVAADQLIIVQRDFFNLLTEALDSKILAKPWIAKKEWASFDFAHLAEVSNDNEAKEVLELLKDENFAYLDDKGHVEYENIGRCILDSGKGYVKLLKKRWERLKTLLVDAKKNKKDVTLNDLELLLSTKFPKKNKKTKDKTSEKDAVKPTEGAKALMAELQKKRPIVVAVSKATIKKISLLNESGIPRFSDLSLFNFKSTALKTHTKAINVLLSQKMKAQEELTLEDLEAVEDDDESTMNSRSASTLFKQFSQSQKLNQNGQFLSEKFLVQGPITNKQLKKQMSDFLQQRHQDYLMVSEEEGYNRLFLTEDHFLVGDQSYSGKKEKVELFDIMRFDSNALSLIHVKEGFGQKTREACAQIRVAAVNIRNALNQGVETLKNFYSQMIKKRDKPTAFRLELQAELKRKFPSEDSFIKAFQTNAQKKQINFVYAFIDDAETERHLNRELSPAKEFKAEDLSEFTKNKKKLFKDLRKKNVLDEHGRLTAEFLRSTKEQFIEKFKDITTKADGLFQFFSKQTSQFDSLVAKIELLELKKFLSALGFNFKICQIPRSNMKMKGNENGFEWSQLSEDDLDGDVESDLLNFEYNKEKYEVQKKSLSGEEVLAQLLKVDGRKEGVLLGALYKKFNTSKDKDKALEFIQKFNSDKIGWKDVAHLLDVQIVFFDKDPKIKGKILIDKPKKFHHKAKKTVCFVKEKNHYLKCDIIVEKGSESDSEPDVEEQFETVFLSQVLSAGDKKILLSQEAHIGMVNKGNNCFFNSICQLIFHSPTLLDFFSEQDNLALLRGTVPQDSLKFFNFWQDLVINYWMNAQKNKALNYSKEQMRKLFDLPTVTQEDASEVFGKIISLYNEFELIKEDLEHKLDLKSKENLVFDNKKDFSQVSNEGLLTAEKSHLMIPILITDNEDNEFDTLLQNSLHVEEDVKQQRRFLYNGKHYSVDEYQSKTTYSLVGDEVFFQIKRFKFISAEKTIKIKSSLGITDLDEVYEEEYQLQGFVVHEGDTVKGGHYYTFCKTDKGWLKFNDGDAPKIMKEAEVLEEANKAYIIHLKKV